MYEVLLEVAKRRRRSFNAHQIAHAIGRHPSQVQRDLDRLSAISVVEALPPAGAARPLRCRETRLARTVLSLPALISDELGSSGRTRQPTQDA
jgi:predicted transcriptional regulator